MPRCRPPSPLPPPPRLLLLALLLALLPALAPGLRARLLRGGGQYLIASFPGLKQINYAVLPDPTWRPLVVKGLNKPEAICVDSDNQRLFIADGMSNVVVWYHFSTRSNGLLMSDGHPYVVMQGILARGLAVDSLGALYAVGRVERAAPLEPIEGVFRQDPVVIAGSHIPGAYREPKLLWSRENTAPSVSPLAPQLFTPSCIAVDPFSVYWGNAARADRVSGSVVKGATTVPSAMPADSLTPLADNADAVAALAMTPTSVFYAAGGRVFGVSRHKTDPSCGPGSELCPSVIALERGHPLKATAMVWDGDSSVYLVDQNSASVYSFAAGSLAKHALTKVADGEGVLGIALYTPLSRATRGRAPAAAALAAAVAAAAWGSLAGWG